LSSKMRRENNVRPRNLRAAVTVAMTVLVVLTIAASSLQPATADDRATFQRSVPLINENNETIAWADVTLACPRTIKNDWNERTMDVSVHISNLSSGLESVYLIGYMRYDLYPASEPSSRSAIGRYFEYERDGDEYHGSASITTGGGDSFDNGVMKLTISWRYVYGNGTEYWFYTQLDGFGPFSVSISKGPISIGAHWIQYVIWAVELALIVLVVMFLLRRRKRKKTERQQREEKERSAEGASYDDSYYGRG